MQALIAIVVGVIAGSLMRGIFGAVVCALLAWLLLRSFQQDRLIAGLQASLKELQALRHRISGLAGQSQAAPPPASAEPAPTGTVAATELDTVWPDLPAPSAAALATSATARRAAASEFATTLPAAFPPKAEAEVELAARASPTAVAAPAPNGDAFGAVQRWLLGGNTIVKGGVAILFIGLAFLAKFASEHVQLPIEMRLASIAGVAIALLVLGWRLRHKRAGYAQVLQGGAVAVLYLTLFVAFRFYGVLSIGPVFALMVVVAALAAALAVLQNAAALAVIGALGGFATPLLVSTGGGNHVALFSYYLVLDLGIAAVAWHRTWRALNLIGFLGTFVIGAAWGIDRYQSQHYASSQAFLIAFFVLFVAIMLMPVRQLGNRSDAERRTDAWVNGSLLFGLPTITFALQHGMVRHTEYGTAISALVLSAFYVVLANWMRRRPQMATAFEGSLAVGTVFLTLVIPFALDARSTAGAWALEGAGLVWLGLRQSRGIARAFGYALLFLAGAAMLFGHQHHGAPVAVFNAYFFNGLMAAAASLTAALFVKRWAKPSQADPDSAAAGEANAEPLLIAWGTLWLLVAAAVQIDNFVYSRYALAAWLATFSAIALLYAGLCLRLDWPRIGLPAMAHAPLHAAGVLLSAVLLARPMQDGLWWAWPLALLVHGVLLWRLAPRWPAGARNAVHTLGVLVLAVLGSLQGRVFTKGWGDYSSAWSWLGWLVVPAALLLWLPRPGSAQRWPLSAAPAAYQTVAAAFLTASLLLWTLLANIVSNGSALPLPHVPLLNPLDLGLAITLFAAWLWMRSEPAEPVLARYPKLSTTLLAGAGFVWLNAILIRAFHHYGDVPFYFNAWVNSLPVQTGITLLWTATALVLMWLSARRADRMLWMAGAALLGAVVLKLMLVDLSGSGTVTRIVSFIGVGVLMLVIGYVAPLPAKGERHAVG